MEEKKPQKAPNIFICDICDFKCYKTRDYNRHLLTAKHKNRTFLNNLEQNMGQNRQYFTCDNCNKTYTARNSLWYHKKNCTTNKTHVALINEEDKISIDKDNIIKFLMNQWFG
jgi:hypothetical protein